MELADDNKVTDTEDDYDHLTHVFNRRIFMILSENTILQAKNNDLPLSFFAINIDNFKKFNDTYGHNQGDLALITIASIIRDGLGRMNILCRYGGDNFFAILPNTIQKEAQDIADQICKSVASHPFMDDSRLTISIGIAFLQPKNDSLIELIVRADSNLYSVKSSKRKVDK